MAYLPLSTANLPDPAIDPAQGSSPQDYFGVVTTTISSATGSISGYNFQPDWVWRKRRDASQNHGLYDAVRGGDKELVSNSTSVENTNANLITAFNSDGFDYGGSMFSLAPYVIWAWKANGSGVSNTDGSIPSTVSVNTESGFSIGTFVGNQTAGATVGHGLSQAPEMIIIKDRPTVNDWPVYHTSISPSQTIKLNSTNAAFTESTIWNNTAPTTSVFTLGSSNLANNNTKSHVFYAFHSVEGYSKIGSYAGNGSATDSPFVYLGFRPAWVLIKQSSGSGTAWNLWDSKRDGYNLDNWQLEADDSKAENTSIQRMTFLSNGFKIHQTSSAQVNASGQTYIYMAFAENPFKYSNAR
jgi:hypothetical protein